MKSTLSRGARGRRAILALALVESALGCQRSPEGEPELGPAVAAALTVPGGFAGSTLVSGLDNPTAMAFAPDGRLFVCEQRGALRVVTAGRLLATPFLRLSVDSEGERGLLGVTFDPAFASNRYLYVYYTVRAPDLHNRLSRFRASASDPNVVESGSETVLLELDPLSSASNHNGGALHFGADGKLYVAVGDNARGANSQSLSNLLGKLLRIDADGSIPTDNPFFMQAAGRNRAIWALGLRNPFTFAVDPGTSRLFINDVGQGAFEEIDEGQAAANYGWPVVEGPSNDSRFRAPVHAYGREGGCAIAGGAFYLRGSSAFPADFAGDYLFADYCGGWVRRLDLPGGAVTTLATGASSPVDVDVGADGAVYVLSRGSGRVERITAVAPSGVPPRISVPPADVEVAIGDSPELTVEASGTAPLSYQWHRDGQPIPGATAATLRLPPVTASDHGARLQVVVSNPFGQAVSEEALLMVAAGSPPLGTITAPSTSSRYRAGQSIHYAATARDAEDGDLPDSAFTFWVDLHHDQHTHPAQAAVTGARGGSFQVPTEGEVSSNVFYRIYLRVRDASGLEHVSFTDVHPLVARVTLASEPAGLTLELDGAAVLAPFVFDGVAGIVRQLGAPSPQAREGRTWRFVRWSDGGATAHAISTPDAAATYTAVFAADMPPPPPPVIYEAEAAVLSGVRLTSEHAGFTGTAFVDYTRASGEFVEWTVQAPRAGSYDLQLRYANASSSLRPLEVRVNGVLQARRAEFPRTTSWTDWRAVALPVSLPAGESRIRATAAGASGPNLDHLRLLPR